MSYTFTTIITQEGKWFVARCAELGVVSQGKSRISAEKNLREAVELFLEDMPRSRRSVFKRPAYVTTMQVQYA